MTNKTEEGSSVLPVRYWGLNPLFWSHMKMFVKEVQRLEEYSDYKGKHDVLSIGMNQSHFFQIDTRSSCFYVLILIHNAPINVKPKGGGGDNAPINVNPRGGGIMHLSMSSPREGVGSGNPREFDFDLYP